jgi:hypothetical protein
MDWDGGKGMWGTYHHLYATEYCGERDIDNSAENDCLGFNVSNASGAPEGEVLRLLVEHLLWNHVIL